MSGADPVISGHVAGRYRLLAHLGTGTAGSVYRAEDLPTGRVVAIKVLADASLYRAARLDREARVLRELGVPGVVRLLDEGEHEGRRFLVTELIDGTPFPGPMTGGWSAIAATVVRLFEILARVHEAGVLHRDLKPQNVLVDAAGAPTVLDFGLARFLGAASALTLTGDVLGTPRYQAPEQVLRGCPVDTRADLYAVGVMVYEALAGRSPQPARSIGGIYSARLVRDPPPLLTLAPGVPVAVARIVDRLVARDPTDRPATARAVLDDLAGAAPARPAGHLPWLGPRGPIARVVAAARDGSPTTVSGLRGAGRTRFLAEVERELRAAGRRIVRILPGERPYESLLVALGEMPPGEVTESVTAALRACLAAGDVLLVDDADQLDPWSAELLERAGGAVIRAVAGGPADDAPGPAAAPTDGDPGPPAEDGAGAPATRVHLAPLLPEALGPLFTRAPAAAPFGAVLLHRRTGGLPSRVAAEVGVWVATGQARWIGDHLAVSDDALELLAMGPPPDARRGRRATPTGLGVPLATTLAWVTIAEPDATVPLLAAAWRRAAWEIEAEVRTLAELRHLVRAEEGRLVARADLEPFDTGSAEGRAVAIGAIARAMAPGAPGRLGRLVATEDWALAHAEAERVAAAALRAGWCGEALAAARWGLVAVAESDAPLPVERLLAAAAHAALALGTPASLTCALTELGRWGDADPGSTTAASAWAATAALLEAVRRDAEEGTGAAADALLLPLGDPVLEGARRDLLEAWARLRDPHGAAVFADPTPTDLRRRLRGEARLRVALGRHDDAATFYARALHADACHGDPERGEASAADERIHLELAEALLEAGASTDAAREGARVAAFAQHRRLPLLAAHATWIGRASAYQAGTLLAADPGFVEQVAALGVAWLTARVCLTEAASAWRSSRYDDAARLARQAVAAEPSAGPVTTLARALELACADNILEDAAYALADAADVLPDPAIGLQVRGLVALALPDHGAALLPGAEALAARAGRLGEIRGVLSGAEAVAFCRAGARRRPGPPARRG